VRESKVMPALEPLEGRIAPATLISPTTVMFQDVDGDIVTVKFSKALFDLATDASRLASANAVLKFSTGTVDTVAKTFTPANPGQQLQLIDLTVARSVSNVNVATGTSISVSVVKGASGDGFTNVGYIHAFEPEFPDNPATTGVNERVAAKEVPLGAVTIAGDLGQIDAGGLNARTGLVSLKVKSLGQADPATTQVAAIAVSLPSSRTLVSNIIGALGSVTVTDDIKGATIRVQNGNSVFGTLGNVTIGGALRGGATTDSGSIISDTNIGAVKIGNTLVEGIFGGAGKDSGTIRAGGGFPGKIASLTISGSIVGGTGEGSGVVSAKTTIGAVKIGGDIDGTTAGSAIGVAGIKAQGAISSITIGGALKGGANSLDAFITSGANIGAIKVGSLVGGVGVNSASISAGGKIASLTVATDIVGGVGIGSAAVSSGTDFNLVGDLGAIKIGGKIQGGASQSSGSISSGGKIASITIGPLAAVDQVLLQGGGGLFSGSIFSRGAIGAVKIKGHVEGGAGDFSGAIVSKDYVSSGLTQAGTLGAVTISGQVTGGGGNDSGQIRADGRIASVSLGTLAKPAVAGVSPAIAAIEGDLTAGAGQRSGSIRAGQGVVEPGITGAITIRGDVVNTGGGVQGGGIISEGRIAGVSILKTLNGGTIRAGDDLGSLTVGGDVTNAGISARGQATQGAASDLAIGKITFKANVTGTSIRAGYDTQFTNPVNADAQIGAVAVTGNWTASNLIAGVIDGGTNGFGTQPDDVKIGGFDNARIVSQIARIVIGGAVAGTPGSGDHFGFVAQRIGALKIAGVVSAFTAAGVQKFELAAAGTTPTNDVTALEVPV